MSIEKGYLYADRTYSDPEYVSLLPCPYCGSKAHIANDERGVVCTYCGAKMQYDFDPERRKAIKAWNIRAK
jgi:Lar family restriction alleviation protein